jgi:hypothetical protein
MRLSILAAILALAIMPFTSAVAEEDMAGDSMGMADCSAESMMGEMHDMMESGAMTDQMDGGMMDGAMDGGMMGAMDGMGMSGMHDMMSCSMPVPDMTPMSPPGM